MVQVQGTNVLVGTTREITALPLEGIFYHLILFVRTKEYFQSLLESGQFEKDNLGDRIAMLVVYMPIVRDAVHAYVELWNHRRIRKQPN